MKYIKAFGVLGLLLASSLSLASINIDESIVFDEAEPIEHGSAILPLQSGNVLLCWYAGSGEAKKDVKIFCRKRTSVGWQERQVVAKAGEKPGNAIFKTAKVANTVLVQGEDGVVYLFFSAIPLSGGFSNARVDYKYSRDEGETWSKPKRVDFNMGSMVKNKPLHMGGTQYLLPMYDELAIFNHRFKNYSYIRRINLSNGKVKVYNTTKIPGGDHIQPALAYCGPNGRVCSYMRNKNRGKTYFSDYNWQKEKWSKRITIDVPNSNSPVDVVNLFYGDILMVYNSSTTRPRSPLSLALSMDGKEFKHIYDLETDPSTDYHYPAVDRDDNGFIHISYTYNGRNGIKYVRFHESELGN